MHATVDVESLKGWLPVDAVVQDGQPGLRWMNFHGIQLSEPFFQQTVARLRSEQPSRIERFTPFDALVSLEKISDSLRPSGFIFHSSRCGSTLVANACKALADSIVISEANAIDKIAGRFITDTDGDRSRAVLYSVFLRGVVSALGQRRNANERRFFIKFSCCTVTQLPQITRIWPEVPVVFLYRNPVETIVSNLANVPEWMTDPDRRLLMSLLNVSSADIEGMTQEELCARAIGSFYSNAQGLAKDNMLLLNYDQLSVDTLLDVVRFFNVALSDEEIRAITMVTRLYSKGATSERTFIADARRKQFSASQLVKDMSERWARAPYDQLEMQRTR